jgi:ankyrin repeat protein
MGKADYVALLKAAESGDVAAVRAALDAGANVECSHAQVRALGRCCVFAPPPRLLRGALARSFCIGQHGAERGAR